MQWYSVLFGACRLISTEGLLATAIDPLTNRYRLPPSKSDKWLLMHSNAYNTIHYKCSSVEQGSGYRQCSYRGCLTFQATNKKTAASQMTTTEMRLQHINYTQLDSIAQPASQLEQDHPRYTLLTDKEPAESVPCSAYAPPSLIAVRACCAHAPSTASMATCSAVQPEQWNQSHEPANGHTQHGAPYPRHFA